MVQNNTSQLPAPIQSTPSTPAPDTSTAGTTLQLNAAPHSTRDVVITVGVLVVVAIVLFFIKNAYANWRVKERVSPSRANASGWFLFVGLLAGALLALVALGGAPVGGIATLGVIAFGGLAAALATFSAKK